MRLIQHLSKGAWAFADKSLPLAYSIGAILLIIRVLPKEEYGLYILVQGMALMMVNLSTSFHLVPMVKFLSESPKDRTLPTVGFVLHVLQLAVLTLLCLILKNQIGIIFHRAEIIPLVIYIPLMAFAGEFRFYTMELFRANYRIKHVFWTDVTYFVASILFVVILTLKGRFLTAGDMCLVTTLAFAASSITGLILARDLIPWKPQFSLATLKRVTSFGKYTVGTGISNEISERADILLIGLFLNPVAVAVYAVAKILWRFFSIFRQIVALLVLPGISRLHADNRIADIGTVYEKTLAFSYLLLAPFGIVMFALATPIITIIYGERYLDAIPILRILACYAFFIAPTAIGSMLLTGMNRPESVFRIRWITTVVNLVLCLALIPLIGTIGAAIAVVASIALTTVMIHREVVRNVSFNLRHVINNITAIPKVVKELRDQYL